MPVSHFWGSIYRNILPSLTQLVAHLSVIYHRPTRSTRPASDFEPDNNLRQNSGQRIVLFFFLSGHTTINLVLQMKKICVKFGQEVGQRGRSCKCRRIVCEVFVSSCKFGCTVAPVWVHAPPCKGRRQYFSGSHRKKELLRTLSLSWDRRYFSDRSLLKFSHCFLKINYL